MRPRLNRGHRNAPFPGEAGTLGEVGVNEEKKELRARIRAARKAGHPGSGQGLLEVARGIPLVADLARPGATVTAFAPMTGEPDVAPLRDWLAGAGCRVLLPVVAKLDGEPALGWAPLTGELAPGASTPTGVRIDEPVGEVVFDPGPVDVVLLPGLAVDRRGYRLGQGAGYYDRTIARLGWAQPGGPTLVIVLHDDEIVDAVPHDEYDQRAHAALTPTRWVDFPPD